MKKNIIVSTIVFVIIWMMFSTACSAPRTVSQKAEKKQSPPEIKLVLSIVVDMLRANMLTNHQSQLGEKGFKYLMNKGVWYRNARYDHCTTITAVNHAGLYTGSTPSEHGIISNYWFDRKTGKEVKSAVGIDPKNPGTTVTGPLQLATTTYGDELVMAYNHKSRVFSVSGKDRAAVLPGGFMGKAFWYSWDSGTFITSEYYYPKDQWPTWLTEWNNQKPAEKFRDKPWELFLKDKSAYLFGDSDDRPEESIYTPNSGNTATFPHQPQEPGFLKKIGSTPFLDDMTLDVAKRIVKEEKLGQGKYPDMLAVSLSATDIIGHTYGPYSLEYEDNFLRLDAALAEFFQFIDQTVGLDKTLIVLTSDHGVDLIPEYRQRLNMPAGRINPNDFNTVIDAALRVKFHINENLTVGFRNPSIFLKEDAIKRLKLNIEEVEEEAARAVMKMKGVSLAVTRTDILKGRTINHKMASYLITAFHPHRSGNIQVLQEPFYFLYHVYDQDSSMHGSPYNYDNHVPLLFVGPGIPSKTVFRRVTPLNIADTVAQLLGTPSPARSTGHPLLDVF